MVGNWGTHTWNQFPKVPLEDCDKLCHVCLLLLLQGLKHSQAYRPIKVSNNINTLSILSVFLEPESYTAKCWEAKTMIELNTLPDLQQFGLLPPLQFLQASQAVFQWKKLSVQCCSILQENDDFFKTVSGKEAGRLPSWSPASPPSQGILAAQPPMQCPTWASGCQLSSSAGRRDGMELLFVSMVD